MTPANGTTIAGGPMVTIRTLFVPPPVAAAGRSDDNNDDPYAMGSTTRAALMHASATAPSTLLPGTSTPLSTIDGAIVGTATRRNRRDRDSVSLCREPASLRLRVSAYDSVQCESASARGT